MSTCLEITISPFICRVVVLVPGQLLQFPVPTPTSFTLYSSGSRISRRWGCRPRRGGANSRGGYVSKNLYVKMKESEPVGRACTGGAPPGSATALPFNQYANKSVPEGCHIYP